MKNKYISTLLFCVFFSVTSWTQCYDELHTPFEQDSWLSCQTAANPNPERPNSHWIMYDLGWEYVLDSTHIWNRNAWGQSGLGVKDLAIDYSLNGTNWTALGTFEIERASASIKYEGVKGPNFNQTPVRYVLLTALNNWNGSGCVGFSEIKFHLDQTTSVDPDLEVANLSVVVSPNPVVVEVQLSFKAPQVPDRLVLYDLAGRQIEERTNLNSKNITLDMSDLAGGIYFAKAWFDGTLLTTKIVKVN